ATRSGPEVCLHPDLATWEFGTPEWLDYRAAMLKGSCACGRVHYEFGGKLLGPITFCHCWRRRKHSGSSFGTTAGVKASKFLTVAGTGLLSRWESNPGFNRFFAGCCGSPIYKRNAAAPGILGVRLGTLDFDPEKTGDVHLMVDSRVPCLRIADGLPQEPGEAPSGKRS